MSRIRLDKMIKALPFMTPTELKSLREALSQQQGDTFPQVPSIPPDALMQMLHDGVYQTGFDAGRLAGERDADARLMAEFQDSHIRLHNAVSNINGLFLAIDYAAKAGQGDKLKAILGYAPEFLGALRNRLRFDVDYVYSNYGLSCDVDSWLEGAAMRNEGLRRLFSENDASELVRIATGKWGAEHQAAEIKYLQSLSPGKKPNEVVDRIFEKVMKLRETLDWDEATTALHNELLQQRTPDEAEELQRFEAWDDPVGNLKQLYGRRMKAKKVT